MITTTVNIKEMKRKRISPAVMGICLLVSIIFGVLLGVELRITHMELPIYVPILAGVALILFMTIIMNLYNKRMESDAYLSDERNMNIRSEEKTFNVVDGNLYLDGKPVKIIYANMGDSIQLFNEDFTNMWIEDSNVADFKQFIIDNKISSFY